MNKRDVEKIASILKDLPEDISNQFLDLDPRIRTELDLWKEYEDEKNNSELNKEINWYKIATKHGAIVVWGNSLTFNVDSTGEEDANKEYEDTYGMKYPYGKTLSDEAIKKLINLGIW